MKLIDKFTGAVHMLPYSPLSYVNRHRDWYHKKVIKNNSITIIDSKSAQNYRGYTSNTILRSNICKTWAPPKNMMAYEDHHLLVHITSKGYTWKILNRCDVMHYSYTSLVDILKKNRWNSAGARYYGYKRLSIKSLREIFSAVMLGIWSSIENRDPRILLFLIVEALGSLQGLILWKKYFILER